MVEDRDAAGRFVSLLGTCTLAGSQAITYYYVVRSTLSRRAKALRPPRSLSSIAPPQHHRITLELGNLKFPTL